MEGDATDPSIQPHFSFSGAETVENADAKESLETSVEPSPFCSSRNKPCKFVHLQKYRDDYTKLTSHSNLDLIAVIRGRLTPQARTVFDSTVVGSFLHMPGTKSSGTLLHYLLSREVVRQDDGDPLCMYFGIGGHTMRFGMAEFALATGLSFKMTTDTMEDVINPYPKSYLDSPIMQTLFPGKEKVRVNDALELLKGNLETYTDDDLAKLALLVFVHVLLLGCQHRDRINAGYCHLVDNLDAFNKFPWAFASYRRTMSTCRAALSVKYGGRTKKARLHKKATTKASDNKNGKDEEGVPPYRVSGFIWALQAWALACIPKIKDLCGRVVEKNSTDSWRPIIFRVSCTKSPEYKSLLSLGQELTVESDNKLYDGDILLKLGIVHGKPAMVDGSVNRSAKESLVEKDRSKVLESSGSSTLFKGGKGDSPTDSPGLKTTGYQLIPSDPKIKEVLNQINEVNTSDEGCGGFENSIGKYSPGVLLDSPTYSPRRDDPKIYDKEEDSDVQIIWETNRPCLEDLGGTGFENSTGKDSPGVSVNSTCSPCPDDAKIYEEKEESEVEITRKTKRPCHADAGHRTNKRQNIIGRTTKPGNKIRSPVTTIKHKGMDRNDYAGEKLNDPDTPKNLKKNLNRFIWIREEAKPKEDQKQAKPKENQKKSKESTDNTRGVEQLMWTDYVKLLGGKGPCSDRLSEVIVNRMLHWMRKNPKLTENANWTTVSSYFACHARDRTTHVSSQEPCYLYYTRQHMEGKYGLDGKPWSKVELVYAPVLINGDHWVAIAIHLSKRKIFIYDSRHDHSHRIRITRRSGIPTEIIAICEALGMTYGSGKWVAEYADCNECVPTQGSGSCSCGVYAICFILRLINGSLDGFMDEEYIKASRRRFAVELYQFKV